MPRPQDNPVCARTPETRRQPRRVLVCSGDRYHSFRDARSGLSPVIEVGGWEVEWAEGSAAPELFPTAAAAVVVLAKANVMSADDPRPWLPDGDTRLRDFVQQGGALLVVHAGLAGYEDVPATRAVAGGHFLHHPPPCDVILEPRREHALIRGVESSFAVFDEQYIIDLTDPGADVFLTAHSMHGSQPAGWTRRDGRGRVCALTPGHFPEVWRDASFQRLLANALQWLTAPEATR